MLASIRSLFACPVCRAPLRRGRADCYTCPEEGIQFPRAQGIWQFVLPDRRPHFSDFIRDYETIRRFEGRSAGRDFYRQLPDRDITGRRSADWSIRAAGYRMFIERVLKPQEIRHSRPLLILDLGAGNAWLSNRLAQRGHVLAAVDILTNDWDGLGAYIHYDTAFEPVQAEFDRLPFQEHSLDLAVFNASLHYSEDFEQTLHESLRLLRPGGCLVVMDSPVYRNPHSGFQMVAEREARFTRQYGFPSNSLQSENFLTFDRLQSLEGKFGLRWQFSQPKYGMRWVLRYWKARLLGRREPAIFPLVAAEK